MPDPTVADFSLSAPGNAPFAVVSSVPAIRMTVLPVGRVGFRIMTACHETGRCEGGLGYTGKD